MSNFTLIKCLLCLTWTKNTDCSISWWIIMCFLFLGCDILGQRFTHLVFTESPHHSCSSFVDKLFIRVVTSGMFSFLLSLSCFSHTLRGLQATTSWAEAEPNLREAFMACNIYVGVSPGFPLMIVNLCCNQYGGSSNWAHYDNSSKSSAQ